MAANPLGEEKSPARARGITPVRAAVLAALAIFVIALLAIALGGNGYTYRLVFQNASQLVTDNQVLIGGSPVGTVDSIDLTDDNLAEVKVTIDQQLHEGSTAVIRATSLAGVANHYVEISPAPDSNEALEDGATIGLESTTAAVDLDQFLNTFPRSVRRGLGQFVRGSAEIWTGVAEEANDTYKYLAPGLNRGSAFARELTADQRLFERFIVASSKIARTVASRSDALADSISNADTAFDAIASQNRAFSRTLRQLPPVFRQSNTTFVNLRAAFDDLDPLVETAKPATRNLAPFLRDLRPVLGRAVRVFRDLRLTTRRPGFANDAAELLAALPAVERRASKAFPRADAAADAFLPNLEFFRAYAPDFFNGIAKVGAITANYDANGNYARVRFSNQNLFDYNAESGQLTPISAGQQYDVWGGGLPVQRRCPGSATQPAPDGSNPFTEPPFAGAGVSAGGACDPTDVPPGP